MSRANIKREMSSTCHDPHIISDFRLVAMGDSNVSNELEKGLRENSRTGEKHPYLGGKRKDNLGGERLRKLEDQDNAKLEPGKRGSFWFVLRMEQWGLFVDSRHGHDDKRERKNGGGSCGRPYFRQI